MIATGDPHHQRAPSLGELHQELEQEQEAQVVRHTAYLSCLSMIHVILTFSSLHIESTLVDDSQPASPAAAASITAADRSRRRDSHR